jgi:hypothetical protein
MACNARSTLLLALHIAVQVLSSQCLAHWLAGAQSLSSLHIALLVFSSLLPLHTALQIKDGNAAGLEAYRQAVEAHRAAQVENKRRMALAQEQQQLAMKQLLVSNAAALDRARQEYKVGAGDECTAQHSTAQHSTAMQVMK